jgi:hypothetical protein
VTGLPRGLLAALVALAVLLGAGLGVAALRRGEPLAGPPAPLRAAADPPSDRAAAGPAAVELSADARTHPYAVLVRDQLQVYFDAINARDYARWTTAVSPERVELQPEEQWRSEYASTRDGTIRVDRIDDLPGRWLLVRVRFTSTQDLAQAPAAAPAERVCWRTSFPMSGVPPRIERSGPSSTPLAC